MEIATGFENSSCSFLKKNLCSLGSRRGGMFFPPLLLPYEYISNSIFSGEISNESKVEGGENSERFERTIKLYQWRLYSLEKKRKKRGRTEYLHSPLKGERESWGEPDGPQTRVSWRYSILVVDPLPSLSFFFFLPRKAAGYPRRSLEINRPL